MGVVRGRVVTRDGAVLSGAMVWALGSGAAETVTDDAGAFALELAPGPAMIGARAPGWGSPEPTWIRLDDAEHGGDVVLTLEPGFSILGRVVAGARPEDGVAGAKVTAWCPRGVPDRPASTITDGEGRFEMHGLMPGSWHVGVMRPGMIPALETKVEIVDRDVLDVCIGVQLGATLSGRVEPPVPVRVGVAPRDEGLLLDPSLARLRRRSDEHGAFSVAGVPPGTVDLVAMADDGQTGEVAVRVGTEDVTNLVIALAPRRTVRGRVRDESGAPLSAYHVMPSPLDWPIARRIQRALWFPSTTTAEDGSFTAVGLDLGRWRIVFQRPGRNGVSSIVVVDVTDGDRDVEVTMATPVACLRGTVTGLDGAPAGGLQVLATPSAAQEAAPGDHHVAAKSSTAVVSEVHEGRDATPHRSSMTMTARSSLRVATATTDRNGAFAIERIPRGAYDLRVTNGIATGAEVRGATTQAEIRIALTAPSSLTIVVTRDGLPAHGVSIDCLHGHEPHHAENVSGAHTFPSLLAASYTLVAHGPAGVAGATVHVDGATTIELALTDGATVTGTFVDTLTGSPIEGLVLMTREGHATTGADGRFELARLRPGEHRITVLAREGLGFGSEQHTYRAEAGERVDLGRIEVPAPRRGPQGTFGLALRADADVLRVEYVARGSPAAGASFVVGDEIRAIAGRPIAQLGVDHARKLLASDNVPIGQTLHIELATGRTVEMTSVPC